jgi:hypothetical protein
MILLNADDIVSRLVVDINDKQAVLDATLDLQAFYPDLIVEIDENKASSLSSVKFMTAEVNEVVDSVDISANNGIIVASPYTTKDGYRVHSIPDNYVIGQDNFNGFGWIPDFDWERNLIGIGKSVVDKIRVVLMQHEPVDYKEA